ncbi:MAG: hypothetical protein ACRDTE_33665 [Pseudonocardiaceae bacterium]
MSAEVWWAVAVVTVTGVAGVALFVASRRGHVRRESMQLAATIAGPLGAVLAAAALIYAAVDITTDDKNRSDNGIRAEHRITIADGRAWNLDGDPPFIANGNGDLFSHDDPEGIGASGDARIAAWPEADPPDRDKCVAILSGMTPKEADYLEAPQRGDLFCVHTRDKNLRSMHYAYGEVEDAGPGEYVVWIVVWTNP